jgi:hypothetical protein
MLPSPEHRRPVRDHGDRVALDRERPGPLDLVADRRADARHARRIGHREIVATLQPDGLDFTSILPPKCSSNRALQDMLHRDALDPAGRSNDRQGGVQARRHRPHQRCRRGTRDRAGHFSAAGLAWAPPLDDRLFRPTPLPARCRDPSRIAPLNVESRRDCASLLFCWHAMACGARGRGAQCSSRRS